jgi:small subunit ribosomal protein S8
MAHTDQIADMLVRLRNAAQALHKSVDVPASNTKKEISRILFEKKFIKKYVVFKDGKQGIIKILLNYNGKDSAIRGMERVSKPGRRAYTQARELPKVLNGLGIAIVSTSKGVMTDAECREMNVGGEVLCRVW